MELWWRTKSVCAVCMLVDNKKSQYYTDAAVVRTTEKEGGKGRVWLVSFCVRHGKHETLLSSDAEFLKRVMGQRLSRVCFFFLFFSFLFFSFLFFSFLFFSLLFSLFLGGSICFDE